MLLCFCCRRAFLLWTSGRKKETRVVVAVVPGPSAGCQSCQRSRPCCLQEPSEKKEKTQVQNKSGFFFFWCSCCPKRPQPLAGARPLGFSAFKRKKYLVCHLLNQFFFVVVLAHPVSVRPRTNKAMSALFLAWQGDQLLSC